MPDQKLISVCIPTFNQTEFLQKTLQSIVSQDFSDYEVIISDDSTNDKVRDLVDKFGSLPIRYYRNLKPLGSPANWNKAMELAGGRYIKMMHHDDCFNMNDALSVFARTAIENPDAAFIFCDSKVDNVGENTSIVLCPEERQLRDLKKNPAVIFNCNFIGAPSAVMFKNDGQRFDENLRYVVDVEFYIRMLKRNRKFKYIHHPLIMNTSNHPGQVTASSLMREIQLGEYSYLYNKVHRGKIPGVRLSWFFIKLFKWYHLTDLQEIAGFGFPVPKPEWCFRLLVFISNRKKDW